VRTTFPCWFDHLVENFSYKDDQFKQFCLSVEISYPSAENINENPGMPYILTGNKHASSKPGISMVTRSSCILMVDSPTDSILFPSVQFQQWPWGTPRLHSTPSLEFVKRAWG